MAVRYTALIISVTLLFCPCVPRAQDCPEPVGRWPYGSNNDVAVDGALALMGNGAALQVIDLTDPSTPEVLGGVFFLEMIDVVALSGEKAFATTGSTLHVIDISSPASPNVLGTLVLASQVHALDIVGDRVYVAGYHGLDIIDVSNPSVPFVLGSWAEFPAYDAKVVGHHVFVTAWNDGLRVVDISNPSLPTEVGELDFGVDRRAERLDVAGGYAVIAGYDGTIPRRRLYIVDVTDPAQPALVSETGGGYDVALSGGLAHVADSLGLQLVDVSDPTDPRQEGFVPTSYDYGKRVALVDGYALVSNKFHGVTVIDVDDPSTPATVSVADAPGLSANAALTGNVLLIAAFSRGLRLIDIADPANPVELGFLEAMVAYDVDVRGDLAFVAGDAGAQLSVVDIGNPSSPVVIGAIPGAWNGLLIEVVDDLAYVAVHYHGLKIIDLSSPTQPLVIGNLDLAGGYWVSMDVSDGVAVLSGTDPAIRIVDVSDPTAPVLASSIAEQWSSLGGVAISGSWLLLGDGLLRIFDLRDPAAPVEQQPYIPWGGGGWITAVGVAGSVAYLGSAQPTGLHKMEVVDIGHPRDPTFMGLSVDMDRPRAFVFNGEGVFAVTDFAGFNTFTLCQGPLFADGFETGDTTAWASTLP
jgi:hypothetical protein